MATSTQAQLQTDADQIRTETTPRANTAQRVGQFLRNLVDTLYAALGNKVDVVAGKGLSSNDYTATDKNLLATNTTNIATNTTALGAKVDKVAGYLLTKNDFTDVLKAKLDGLTNLNATSIRVDETDAPSGTIAVGAGHLANDIWINANSGIIWQLNADRSLYVKKGTSLKGRAGNQWLVGYAEDDQGTNYSLSPVGKKWRAEYLAATDTETFSASKATSLWVPFSTLKTNGLYNLTGTGTTMDLNVDFQSAIDFTGAWSITALKNAYLGVSAQVTRKSLNNTYASTGLSATIGASTLTQVTTSAAHGLTPGAIVRINGQVRNVQGIATTTSFVLDFALSGAYSGTLFDKIIPDSFVILGANLVNNTAAVLTSTMSVNGYATASVIVSVYGTFIVGATNIVNWLCTNVTGTGNARAYEFTLTIG